MFTRKQSLVIPGPVLQWKFGEKSRNVQAQNTYRGNDGYSLFCTGNNKFLTYARTNLGINLGYIGDNSDKKIHLVLPDRQEREILTGELVGFGIGGGDAFLRYQERTVGINLEWAKNPAFEWRIFTASGEIGKPIAVGEKVAIVNVNVRPDIDFLIYFERPAGASIGWTTSPGWYQKFKKGYPYLDRLVKAATTFIKTYAFIAR
jgi:hypothetical protein